MKKITLLFVFATSFTSAQNYTLLHNFDSINGRYSNSSLISDGNYLYGTTFYGGTNDKGIVFKTKPDGSNFTVLHYFDSITFATPLTFDGTYLYGTTYGGGTNNRGIIFRLKTDGTAYAKLHDFSGGNSFGQLGASSLVGDGAYLYGTTDYGGSFGYGTIFKIKADGTNFTVLHNFNGTNGAGASPVLGFGESLMYDGTYLYGTTSGGGISNYGVIFKIKPDGTGFLKLHDFNSVDGWAPFGGLVSDGTFLYGVTAFGGTQINASGYGTIFKIKFDGTNFVSLFDFNSVGSFPQGALVCAGSYLCGVSYDGNVYKIKPDGTDYTSLHQFNNDFTLGALFNDGSFLYGTTRGGTSNYGTIYKIGASCLSIPTVAITSNTTTICSGEAVTFSASGASTYMWSTGATAASITASPAVTALYSVTGTDSVGCTNNNIILISVLPCTGIEEVTSLKSEVKSYPNPANSEIYFDVPNEEDFDVEIYNTLGQLVLSKNNYTNRSAINISALNKNLYFCKIKTPKNNYTGKFVKE